MSSAPIFSRATPRSIQLLPLIRVVIPLRTSVPSAPVWVGPRYGPQWSSPAWVGLPQWSALNRDGLDRLLHSFTPANKRRRVRSGLESTGNVWRTRTGAWAVVFREGDKWFQRWAESRNDGIVYLSGMFQMTPPRNIYIHTARDKAGIQETAGVHWEPPTRTMAYIV